MKIAAQLASALLTAAIFTLSIFGRQFERTYPQTVGMLPYIGGATLVGFFLLALATLNRRSFSSGDIDEVTPNDGCSMGSTLILCALSLIFIWMFESLIELPIERIHLVKYGTLGILLVVALRSDSSYLPIRSALLLGIGIGVLDESIQGIVPDRFFDWKDIVLNSLGVSIGVIVSMLLQRLRQTLRRMNVRSETSS